jgi:hypothetical protein
MHGLLLVAGNRASVIYGRPHVFIVYSYKSLSNSYDSFLPNPHPDPLMSSHRNNCGTATVGITSARTVSWNRILSADVIVRTSHLHAPSGQAQEEQEHEVQPVMVIDLTVRRSRKFVVSGL